MSIDKRFGISLLGCLIGSPCALMGFMIAFGPPSQPFSSYPEQQKVGYVMMVVGALIVVGALFFFIQGKPKKD